MDDKTTTDPPADDTGADLLQDAALPAEQTDKTAATEANEQTTSETTEEPAKGDADASLPEADEKLKTWAESKGIALDSANAVKAAKIAMDNQAEFQRTNQKASELEKTLTTGLQEQAANADTDEGVVSQLAAEVQSLKLTQNVNTFFNQNPEAKALEGKMTEMVTERPELGQLVSGGYLSLKDLYNLARASDANYGEQLKADGGREALQKVAEKQQGKAVTGVATSSEMSPAADDPFLAGFDKGASKY